jgi:hypothetical protein
MPKDYVILEEAADNGTIDPGGVRTPVVSGSMVIVL